MKVNVFVTLKRGVLDPAGKSLNNSLESLGFNGVQDVRIGKYIELSIADDSKDNSDESIRDMCEKLLSNPVIEDYRIERQG